MAAAKCSSSTPLSKSNALNRALRLRRASLYDPRPKRRVHTGKGEPKCPSWKTKSGAKKRFKVTATGKVLYAQSGKRHGMIKRSTKQIRDHRGTKVLFKTDGDKIKKYWLPNA